MAETIEACLAFGFFADSPDFPPGAGVVGLELPDKAGPRYFIAVKNSVFRSSRAGPRHFSPENWARTPIDEWRKALEVSPSLVEGLICTWHLLVGAVEVEPQA